MNVTIAQRRFTLRSEYDISAPDCNYYAEKKLFSFRDRLRLLTEDRRLVARITRKFSWFREKYEFGLSDGKIYHFRTERIWKPTFVCESQNESFRLYEHKGLKWSIFQSDHQIAAFTTNRVTIGGGHRYEIRMNRDANVVVVICMALTVDTSENEDDHDTVSIDFGNVGPEARRFDESWEPS